MKSAMEWHAFSRACSLVATASDMRRGRRWTTPRRALKPGFVPCVQPGRRAGSRKCDLHVGLTPTRRRLVPSSSTWPARNRGPAGASIRARLNWRHQQATTGGGQELPRRDGLSPGSTASPSWSRPPGPPPEYPRPNACTRRPASSRTRAILPAPSAALRREHA
jgi:hypothetical protein